jgi:hypothetical protein
MKGWYWFIMLNKDNQRRWMDNMFNHINHEDFDRITTILNLEYESLKEFITSSFLWDVTPEGCEYWHKIENNNKENKLKFNLV